MAVSRSRSRKSHAHAIRNRRGESPDTIIVSEPKKSRADIARAIRNLRGEMAAEISATEAKNNLGEILDKVLRSGIVLITKHETPRAVLLSMEEYGELSRPADSRLDTLSGEFDAMLAQMQTSKARAGMKAAFAASSKQLGKAAVLAARKRAG